MMNVRRLAILGALGIALTVVTACSPQSTPAPSDAPTPASTPAPPDDERGGAAR